MTWVDSTSHDASTAETLVGGARPLLELLQRLTGLETTFITRIDWASQRQQVVVARNTADVLVAEGTGVDWEESMCRWVFLSGKDHSAQVDRDFAGSVGADQLGMKTFFALPILDGDGVIGTVCGASRRVVELEDDVLEMVALVAEALAHQMRTECEAHSNRRRAEAMEELALTDDLTGLANRRSFTARWEQELARSSRHGHDIALLTLDVDHFKAVNDAYGHTVGDDVLRALADAMRRCARIDDIVARLGGDEFVVACPHTGAVGARELSSRIASAFGELARAAGVSSTISVGISSSEDTPRRDLLAAADRALYRSKALGRDRAEIWLD